MLILLLHHNSKVLGVPDIHQQESRGVDWFLGQLGNTLVQSQTKNLRHLHQLMHVRWTRAGYHLH